MRAGGVHGSGPDFVVQMVEFFAGDADDLRAFSRFLQSLLDLVLDPGAVDKAVPLMPSEFQRVGFAGLLRRLEAKGNRPRIVARQKIVHGLGDLASGLLDGEGLVVGGLLFAGHITIPFLYLFQLPTLNKPVELLLNPTRHCPASDQHSQFHVDRERLHCWYATAKYAGIHFVGLSCCRHLSPTGVVMSTRDNRS